MMDPLRIGLLGCGRISDIYLQNCNRYDELDVVACASLDIKETRAKAAKYNIAKACDTEDLLSDPDIDCILNLTVPAAHAEIILRTLAAGKHVYSEKPIVTQLNDGKKILELAQKNNLVVGNAPDTFLGGRWQTCRELLDQGLIGKPTAIFAFVGTHGVERHNPNPDFYYQMGGGPLLDLGPYYLTAMVFLLGSISRVSGMASRAFEKRMIENGPRFGQWMDVEVDTHSQSMFEFSSGVIGSMTISFDIWDSQTPRLEIYGENGTICIPDPDPVHGANIFEGEVWYRTKDTSRWTHQPRPTGREDWQVAENKFGYNYNARGLGLLDLSYAIHEGRKPRASAELAYHVFEVMDAILSSSESGQFKTIESRCTRPQPLPARFPQYNGV